MYLQGLQGAIVQMISHGIISAALFFCIGSIYNRYKTKEINYFGGLSQKVPKMSVFFLIFTLGAIGFPGSSGFIGEFLTLMSAYSRSTLVAFISSFGVILAATYMLLLYKKVFLGPINPNIDKKINQLHVNETITFLALSVMILIIGIKPNLNLSNSYLSARNPQLRRATIMIRPPIPRINPAELSLYPASSAAVVRNPDIVTTAAAEKAPAIDAIRR